MATKLFIIVKLNEKSILKDVNLVDVSANVYCNYVKALAFVLKSIKSFGFLALLSVLLTWFRCPCVYSGYR